MFNEKQELLLGFCRELTQASETNLETLMSAVARMAPHHRLSLLTIDMSDVQDFIPDASTRFLTLYQDPDQSDRGEPITFKYRVSHEGYIVVNIYPKGEPFTEDEAKEYEILSDINFFYFGRIRFADVVTKSAMTQYITGLPNSGGYMAKAVELFRRGVLPEYTAFFFNIKGFGNVARRYGQQEGNFIIKRYGKAVKDFAHDDEVVGHLGGDNFVAMMKKERRQEFISFLSAVPAMAERGGKTENFNLSATVGVYEIDENTKDPGDVLNYPSIAINLAKNVLHQQVVEISDEMVTQVEEQKKVLKNFQAALDREEFEVYYQPKVDSESKKIIGAEGLTRWNKNGEIIPPEVFIPPLEQEGMIAKLDFYVLRRACEDVLKWEEMGLEPVPVSVNFSKKDLSDKDLAEHIYETIVESGVDKKLIQIEITEATDDEEQAELAAFLDELYQMGIKTAIDDFGAGRSSLSILREFRVNALNFARSFIDTDEFSKRDGIILADIMHTAQQLGIQVIIKGVEREDQLKSVNEAGCNLIQGFYYDKALPEGEFRKKLLTGFIA